MYIKGGARGRARGPLKRGIMEQHITFSHVGEYLVQLLEERGTTIGEVAKVTGLSPGILACLVAGRQILTADVAFALADALELSPLGLIEVQRCCCLDARDREARKLTLAA